jgi:hypothetical protein
VTIIARTTLLVTIIVLGLALRRFGAGLGIPASIVKYGGSILWGAMMFFLVAIALPRFSSWPAAAISGVITVGVEVFRLFHIPWLDEFRLTLAGALLLGRIFSVWNILAYGAGILLALGLDRLGGSTLATEKPHSPS